MPPESTPVRSRDAVRGSSIKLLVERAIAESHDVMHISDAGARWLTCVVNPFGTGERGSVPVLERLPDSDSDATCLVYESGIANWAAGNNPSVIIQLQGHCVSGSTTDQSLSITYGADATDPTATMTTVGEFFCLQYNTIGSMITSAEKMRCISAGLRVRATSAPEVTSGVLEAFESSTNLRSAAATYNANAYFFNNPLGPTQLLTQGMVLRKTVNSQSRLFALPPTYCYSTSTTGKLPTIRVSGLNTATTFSVEWCCVYESIPSFASPIPRAYSHVEPDLEQLIAYANSLPISSTADSFKSFFEGTWKGIKKAGAWLIRNRESIAQLAGLAAPISKP
jgi:hypothetical protein